MTAVKPTRLTPSDAEWPRSLSERLGASAPAALRSIGPVGLLNHRKTALFCSVRTPGDVILRAFDTARQLRDQGATVIGGFHSPMEKDCLSILLRGTQPIIICPARSIDGMRIPAKCRPAFDAGRLLFLSPFADAPRRVTKESAVYRNTVVAALADEAFVAYAAPGGQAARIADRLNRWGVSMVGWGADHEAPRY